jgi:choline dehydrogenase-like flavoprotein
MFIDGRTLPSAPIEADVCIVGGGAAGITLANKFAGSRTRVVLLESGGDHLEKETERLNNNATVTGEPYPLNTTRLRFFGGTTNHWSGHCYQFMEGDLARSFQGDGVAWPIRMADVAPYYAEAARLSLHRDPVSWSIDEWRKRTKAEAWPIDGARFPSRVFQVGDLDPGTETRTFTTYKAPLERAPNVQVVQHANVTEFVTNPEGAEVAEARVRTLAGGNFSVRARYFVLAAGGVENPRLLLTSRSANPRGLGNQHDQVGRYFTDHAVLFQDFILNPSVSVDKLMNVSKLSNGSWASFHYTINDKVLNQNFDDEVFIRVDPVYEPVTPGVAALQRIKRGVVAREMAQVQREDLALAMQDLGSVAGHAGRKLYCGVPDRYQVAARIAPSASRDSRITLRKEIDAVGMPMINLNWALPDSAKYAAHHAMKLFAAEVGRTNVGRMRLTFDPARPWPKPPELEVGYHHTCTTRMSDDPKRGVVDRNCRVHGVSNLFVAGSSVFSSAGSGSTTMMLVALTLRLADHLQEQML